jgi:phosphoribosyl-ATP pyrophosphohydrolase
MTLNELFEIISERRDHPTPESYTCSLFSAGEDKIIKKVGEEAMEVILAAKGQTRQRLVEEVADLTYHTLVLLAEKGLTPDDIQHELERRHKK